MLNPNEKLEPLGRGIQVIANQIHRFNTDTILLANFAKAEKSKQAADLGSGCGTIPLLWAKQEKPVEIKAVEIQPEAADMLKRSVIHNKLESRIQVINGDLRELKGVLPFGFFDLVACNPPYKHTGSGIINPDEQKTLARHEQTCTLEEVTAAASKLLQFGGRFCMCQRPERLTDILYCMRKADLEPKRLRMVQQRKAKEPKLVLIEGRKGGKPGSLITLPALLIEDDTGGFSAEMMEIYGDYKTKETPKKNLQGVT